MRPPDQSVFADPRFADVIDGIAAAIAARVAEHLQPARPQATDVWLKADEAARYVKLSQARLEALRRIGGGPDFERNGRRVRYRAAALDSWLASRGKGA